MSEKKQTGQIVVSLYGDGTADVKFVGKVDIMDIPLAKYTIQMSYHADYLNSLREEELKKIKFNSEMVEKEEAERKARDAALAEAQKAELLREKNAKLEQERIFQRAIEEQAKKENAALEKLRREKNSAQIERIESLMQAEVTDQEVKDALQKQESKEEVSSTAEAGEDLPQNNDGISGSESGTEASGESETGEG